MATPDLPSPEGTTELVAVNEEYEPETLFPPFDPSTFASQLLWLALTFGLLYYLMSKFVVPRIAGILEDRRDRIASDLETADRLKRESDEAIAAYEQELAEARQRAHQIAQTTRERNQSELEARQAAVDAELAERAQAAEARIHELRARAMADVDAVAADVATTIVERLIGTPVQRDEVENAVKSVRAA
jgi:F-type H+-transporting ATPase subunit b